MVTRFWRVRNPRPNFAVLCGLPPISIPASTGAAGSLAVRGFTRKEVHACMRGWYCFAPPVRPPEVDRTWSEIRGRRTQKGASLGRCKDGSTRTDVGQDLAAFGEKWSHLGRLRTILWPDIAQTGGSNMGQRWRRSDMFALVVTGRIVVEPNVDVIERNPSLRKTARPRSRCCQQQRKLGGHKSWDPTKVSS